MIKLQRINKRYKETIIKDGNLVLPSSGLVVLKGESGTGKTTLLSIIGQLNRDYQGDIIIDGISMKKIKDIDLDLFVFNNIGFVFQNYSLIEEISVRQNILIKNRKNTKDLNSIIEDLNLTTIINQKCALLSGGEKQRVAIARALASGAKIILCDEPTSSLDQENKIMLLKLLKELSKRLLILIVTHEEELFTTDATLLISIENHHLKANYRKPLDLTNMIIKTKNKNFLPFNIQKKLFIALIKKQKIKYYFSFFCFLLCFVVIGFSNMINYSMQETINQQFNGMSEANYAIMNRDISVDQDPSRISANRYLIDEIRNDFQNISRIGTYYLTEISSFFVDQNDLFLIDGQKEFLLTDGVDAINEFELITELDTLDLKDDEIILGITEQEKSLIESKLDLNAQSFEKLNDVIKKNYLYACLKVKNNSWHYDDQNLFLIKELVPCDRLKIFHSNPFFNELVFENMMQLPSSLDLARKEIYPWTLKKTYYIEPTSNSSFAFFEDFFINDKYQNYLLNPYFFKDKVRFFVTIENFYKGNILKAIKKLNSFDYVNSYQFSIMDFYSYLTPFSLSGFNRSFYISSNYESFKDLIDQRSVEDLNVDLQHYENVFNGHIGNVYENDFFNFRNQNIKTLIGDKAKKLDEIVISKGCATKLFKNKNVNELIGHKLYVAYQDSSLIVEDKIKNHFVESELTIVGISDEEESFIAHEPLWLLAYPLIKYLHDPYKLVISDLFVQIDASSNVIKILDRLKEEFPNYAISNGMIGVKKSIDDLSLFIKYLVAIFKVLFIASTIVLVIYESKDAFEKQKRNIAIFRSLGFSKNSISGLLTFPLCICIVLAYLIVNVIYAFVTKSTNLFKILCVNYQIFLFAVFLMIIFEILSRNKIKKLVILDAIS